MRRVNRRFGRQLCRVGLHRWGRVREITGLKFESASPAPNGDAQVRFTPTSRRYAMLCQRPTCRAEQAAFEPWRNVGAHRVRDGVEPSTSPAPPDPPPR